MSFSVISGNNNRDIKRMWINAPSLGHSMNNLNGTNVLAVAETDDLYRIYFLEGNVVSQQCPKNVLSNGWVNRRK